MSNWQPIETAPKDGSEMLTWSEGLFYLISWSEKDKNWIADDGFPVVARHWQPLPKPPQVEAMQ